MHEIGREYLENHIGIALHLETFDGHGASQVVSIAHICEPTRVANPPNTDELLLKDI